MTEYRIDYSVTTHDDVWVTGIAQATNDTMNEQVAQQYAAYDLFDTTDVTPGDIDVNTIDVRWSEA